MWIERVISKKLAELASQRPVVLVTGARQTGKTSLLQHQFSSADYVNFDLPTRAEQAELNPETFLTQFKTSVIFDEIQYVPSLFRYLKARVDSERQKTGHWLLTGSQKFSLMKEASESLAGRISIIELETLSWPEVAPFASSGIEYLLRGGYPELWQNKDLNRNQFFDDYLVTYLQRDLQQVLDVSNLRAFDRYLRATALRCSQLVNYTDLAKDAGVSGVTGKRWFEALYTSNICGTLEPFFHNQLKRLVKSPKIYFKDVGFLCYLLNINTAEDFKNSPYRGALFENLVYKELVTQLQIAKDKARLYFIRDKNNHEIDFVIEKGRDLILIETKASERVNAKELNFERISDKLKHHYNIKRYVYCLIDSDMPIEKDNVTYVNPLRQVRSL